MNRKQFGKRLNAARKDKGITSEQLAELCSINATYLRQIEAGSKTPSLPVFVSLCRELKVSPSYLLSDELAVPEIQDMDALWELWRTATPKQIKMISAMVRSALDNSEN